MNRFPLSHKGDVTPVSQFFKMVVWFNAQMIAMTTILWAAVAVADEPNGVAEKEAATSDEKPE